MYELLISLKRRLVAIDEIMDAFNGIEQIADGLVMVEGIDDICNVLAHINLNVPLLGEQFGRTVDKVCGEDLVKDTVLICSIDFLKAIGEETEGFEDEDTLCALLLELNSDIED